MRQISHSEDISHLVPIVLEAAGLPGGRVVRERSGIGNHVYRVNREYIVRLGSGSDGAEFGKSCELLRTFHGAIPCPELLYADLDCGIVGLPAMVCAYIEGTNLQRVWPDLENKQRRTVFEELLAILDVIHAQDWRALTWCRGMGDWARERREKMVTAFDAARADETLDQALITRYAEFWDAHHHELDAVEAPVLIHNDVHVGNVIVGDELRLRGLLDFDDAEISPPEVEFWNLTDELLELPDTLDLAQIKAMLAPWFEFGGEESRLRYLLNDAYWHLIMLTEGVSWRSKASCRRSAERSWREIFVEGRNDAWFQ